MSGFSQFKNNCAMAAGMLHVMKEDTRFSQEEQDLIAEVEIILIRKSKSEVLQPIADNLDAEFEDDT